MVKPFDGLQAFVPSQLARKLGAIQRVGNLVQIVAHTVDLRNQAT